MRAGSPTIGIVTISYNQAKFLEECILSVDMREREELHHVIVDPGSTDGSREIILKHKESFRDFLFEPDSGPTNGLNKGFRMCRGEILGYLNSDDRLLPGTLDWVQHYFESHPHVDAIMGAVTILDSEGRRAPRKRIPIGVTLQDFVDGTQLYLQQATFFRRSLFEAVGGFDEANRTSWDTEIVVRMLMAGGRFAVVNKVLGEFRLYPESITGQHIVAHSASVEERVESELASARAAARDSGVVASRGLFLKMKRLWFVVNPIRRIREWTVR